AAYAAALSDLRPVAGRATCASRHPRRDAAVSDCKHRQQGKQSSVDHIAPSIPTYGNRSRQQQLHQSKQESTNRHGYPLQLLLTLKSYSAGSDSNYYRCGSQGGNISMSMCGYRLQVEAAADGVPVGYELFGKQVYREELNFEQRNEPGYRNPVKFNLTGYPNNITVKMTLHYYSSDGRKVDKTFRETITRVPLAFAGDKRTKPLKDQNGRVSHSTLKCRPNHYGPFCSTYCRAETTGQYCDSNGQLMCRITASMRHQPKTPVQSTVVSRIAASTKTVTEPKKQPTKTDFEKPLHPVAGSTPDSLGDSQKQVIDPLVLTVSLCAAVVVFALLVLGLSAIACVTGRRKPLTVTSSSRQNELQQLQNQQQPTPPPPLSLADCDMLFYPASATADARQLQRQQLPLLGQCHAGYEPLRSPDGAEMPPNSHLAYSDDGHLAGGHATDCSTAKASASSNFISGGISSALIRCFDSMSKRCAMRLSLLRDSNPAPPALVAAGSRSTLTRHPPADLVDSRAGGGAGPPLLKAAVSTEANGRSFLQCTLQRSDLRPRDQPSAVDVERRIDDRSDCGIGVNVSEVAQVFE
uniref:DSL domain-containing protein n=1 Tax=Macrostomum lignano TaxID=282301 RepID=A0A1I8FF11_9PLAT